MGGNVFSRQSCLSIHDTGAQPDYQKTAVRRIAPRWNVALVQANRETLPPSVGPSNQNGAMVSGVVVHPPLAHMRQLFPFPGWLYRND